MIYFIEHDADGNILHACGDPVITIVPLVSRVSFLGPDKQVLKDSDGNLLSPYSKKMAEPVGVDVATFNSLMADGLDKYTYDATKGVTKKPSEA